MTSIAVMGPSTDTTRAGTGGDLVRTARAVAEEVLDGDRLRHSAGVAARAVELTAAVPPPLAETLVAAAWLHDIGYGPAAVETGFHPLDGARLLERLGWPTRITGLVANHSGAGFVAERLGLAGALARYPDERSALSEALTYADQTTGPTGQRLPIRLRIANMLARHGSDSVNARVHARRGPYLLALAERVEYRLRTAQLATYPRPHHW